MNTGRDTIQAASDRFDRDLHTENYHKIHSDDTQRDKLVGMMETVPDRSYLDIGTGNGYMALAMARRFPECRITGLDITPNALRENTRLAEAEGIRNLFFCRYNGLDLPFDDKTFDGIVSRYALHHFPAIGDSLDEIRRVTRPSGYFLLSDPVTLESDTENFVDRFQSLLPDGHVHFWRRREIIELFGSRGFTVEKEFFSSIRYPREMDQKYQALIGDTAGEILRDYQIGVEDNKIYITVSVMNILFRSGNHP